MATPGPPGTCDGDGRPRDANSQKKRYTCRVPEVLFAKQQPFNSHRLILQFQCFRAVELGIRSPFTFQHVRCRSLLECKHHKTSFGETRSTNFWTQSPNNWQWKAYFGDV